jgi:hypothetical protein
MTNKETCAGSVSGIEIELTDCMMTTKFVGQE